MNKIFKYILIYVLLIISIPLARVLIIVESAYYNDPEGHWRTDRYAHEVDSIDGKNVEIIEFSHPGTGTTREQCKPVWDILMAEYVANPSDTVEGAVFIGNIPEPMFMRADIKIKNPIDSVPDTIYIHGGITYPCDYYYMDLKDRSANPDTLWKNDIDIWTFPITYNPPPKHYLYTLLNDSCNEVDYDTLYYFDGIWGGNGAYKGDDSVEIWVSRIYAKPLLHYPRDTGFAVWDTGGFYEENEIISNYLDKVHLWMTGQSEVPERTIAMGHIQGYCNNTQALNWLKNCIGFDALDVEQRRYFIYPENNAPNWQSQLQAGPYGNVNAGAFMGVKNDAVNESDNTYSEFASWDTRGFTWAGVVEHGHREGHTFNRTSVVSRGGNFDAVNNVPLWTEVETGGFDGGNYFISHNRDKYDINYSQYFNAYWYHELDTSDTGWYSFQIWYAPDHANDANGYLNIVVDDDYVKGGWINQQNSYGSNPDNWQVRFDSVHISLSDFHRNMEHRIYVSLTSHYWSSDTVNDRAIADAIRFVNLSTNDTLLVDNDSPRFYCSNWNERQFYLMPDDGGPSKVKFFIHNVCELNLFTLERVGLLYAMGHNGLISFGTSMTNFGPMDNKPLLMAVQNGGTFGEGLIEMANSEDLTADPIFSLLGAGTLKSNAGKHYIDTSFLYISNRDIVSNEFYWVGDSSKIELDVTIHSGSSLSIIAGNLIHIKPEFHAEYGSQVHFKIDTKLKGL